MIRISTSENASIVRTLFDLFSVWFIVFTAFFCCSFIVNLVSSLFSCRKNSDVLECKSRTCLVPQKKVWFPKERRKGWLSRLLGCLLQNAIFASLKTSCPFFRPNFCLKIAPKSVLFGKKSLRRWEIVLLVTVTIFASVSLCDLFRETVLHPARGICNEQKEKRAV